MITGFNTDVEHEGRVFHVQTEERGSKNPVVESLVYSGGEIVASKKTSYSDLVESPDFSDEKVLERMEKQHQALIREIYSGKFDPEGPKPFGYNLVSNRSLDEVVLEYLSSEIGVERIRIELENNERLVEGKATLLKLRVMAEGSDRPIAGSRVAIKHISNKEAPAELFTGVTARDGRVEAGIEIPHMEDGNSAVLCQAEVEGNNAELKLLVRRAEPEV